MEDMTEKLSNLDDNGDQLGKHLHLSDGNDAIMKSKASEGRELSGFYQISTMTR